MLILSNLFYEIIDLNIEVMLYVQDDMNKKLNLVLFSLLYDLNHRETNWNSLDEYNMVTYDIMKKSFH